MFKYHIFTECNPQQVEELKKPLKEMGYEVKSLMTSHFSAVYVNPIGHPNTLASSSYTISTLPDSEDKYIKIPYNKELILALACIREDGKEVKGQWFKNIITVDDSFTVGKLYQLQNDNLSGSGCFINNENRYDGFSALVGGNKRHFTPATPEELIAHFTPKYQSIPPAVAEASKEAAKEHIVPDYVKVIESVLPEKWAVKRNFSNYKVINKWLNEKYPRGWHYTDASGYMHSEDLVENRGLPKWGFGLQSGFTEITFEQFKRDVMKTSIEDIVAYKAPYDLFDGVVKKGDWYKKRDKANLYGRVNERLEFLSFNAFEIPKEIVETWEPVYKPKDVEFKLNDRTLILQKGGFDVDNKRVTYNAIQGLLDMQYPNTPFRVTPESFEIGCMKGIKVETLKELVRIGKTL